MNTNNRKAIESKVGTKTLKFSNTSAIIWNTRRRYK